MVAMAGRVEGKVAFITGIARGQGRAHAVRLAGEGADIIGIDLCEQMPGVEYPMATEDDLKQTVALVEGLDRRIVAGQADVRDASSMRAVLEEGLSRLGRLDFVIANAGIMPIWGEKAQTMQAWHDCLDVLLTGVLNTVELAYPIVRDAGNGGSIVITSSMAALAPMMWTEDSHTLGLLGYSAAKSALINLARNYASILATHYIRVNTIHPTGVDTPMINNDMSRGRFERADPEDLRALVNAIPVTRVDPVDIANAVLWLCSDESRYYTGNAMRLDAGASLR
jgi:SDR family mycofactocin-dependent oxidoreductase